MPQGRRKTPFSGKAKKDQLKAKKQATTQVQKGNISKPILTHDSNDDDEQPTQSHTQKINYQSTRAGRANPNRYALQFHRETDSELNARKELARQSLHTVSESEMEIDEDQFFIRELDFPKRPSWSYKMSKEELDSKENRYFTEYISNVEKKFDWKELGYFELNLETWRQLWRVLEMSDIILVIVDIRFPALMFPPSLYEYVTETLKKDVVLLLNKIDLCPAPLVAAWKNYFEEKYPELHIVMFTTLPGYNLIGKKSDKAGLQIRRRRGKIQMAAEGTQLLFDACKRIVGNEVDISSWQNKIKEETSTAYEDDDDNVEVGEVITVKNVDTGFYEHEKYKNGILTIGCIGQQNVGKSSLLNAIMGKKVVSVSKTPGHTKHFQTIFLTPNVRLCDCPGLVFPSKVPKMLQVLMGSFPIAQLREPFTTIKYLAERLNLPQLLRIVHPEGDNQWSAMDVCDGWAKKRGFLTAKAARLDTYRAANNLLRMALDGKICLCLRPSDFSKKKEHWKNHPDVKTVEWIQSKSSDELEGQGDVAHSSDHDTSPSSSKAHNVSQSEEDDSEESDCQSGQEEFVAKTNKFSLLNDAE